ERAGERTGRLRRSPSRSLPALRWPEPAGHRGRRDLAALARLHRLCLGGRARMVLDDAAEGGGTRMTPGLSINLATIRQQCTLPQAGELGLRQEVGGIAPWRDQVHAVGLAEAARIVRASGLKVTGLCRGGMFPAATEAARRANIEDNRRAIE